MTIAAFILGFVGLVLALVMRRNERRAALAHGAADLHHPRSPREQTRVHAQSLHSVAMPDLWKPRQS